MWIEAVRLVGLVGDHDRAVQLRTNAGGKASMADKDYLPPSTVDIGRMEDGRVVSDAWRSSADTPSSQEEGFRGHVPMEAIYQAAEAGTSVRI